MSSRIVRSMAPSLALIKRAPSSASAAEARTDFISALLTRIGPLNGGGVESGAGAVFGSTRPLLRKK